MNTIIDTSCKRLNTTVEKFVGVNKQLLNTLQEQLKQNASKQENKIKMYQTNLQTMMQKQKEENTKLKLQILKNVEQLLDSNIQQQENQFATTVAGINQSMDETLKEMEVLQECTNTCVTNVTNSVLAHQQAVIDSHNETLKTAEDKSKEIYKLIEDTCGDIKMLDSMINNTASDLSKCTQEHSKTYNEKIIEECAQMTKFCNDHQATISKQTNIYNSKKQKAFTVFADVNNSIDRFAETESLRNQQHIDRVQAFANNQQEMYNKIKEDVSNLSKNWKVNITIN